MTFVSPTRISWRTERTISPARTFAMKPIQVCCFIALAVLSSGTAGAKEPASNQRGTHVQSWRGALYRHHATPAARRIGRACACYGYAAGVTRSNQEIPNSIGYWSGWKKNF